MIKQMVLRLVLGSLTLLIAGCIQSPSAITAVVEEPAKSANASGQSRRELRMPLADGFEADSLARFWLPGDYGTGLYVHGAIVTSSDYVRSGKQSARITLKEGDIEQRGDDGKSVERAELDSGHYPLLGKDVWYGFSFLLPPGFPIVDNRLVLASVKQSDVEGSPLIGQRFRNGKHTLSILPPGAWLGAKNYNLPGIRLGSWIDMVYHVRYSTEKDGLIEIWMNGDRVVSYQGKTASKDGADRFYHKVGLYRDRWKEPMTMYLDNYTLGDSFEAVDPSKFDERK